jgi:glycosyltransferase involved in cell wall biosynthesis
MGKNQNHNSVKVSIITVVYNGASTIADCIESVINQTYQDIEYIVIDGASNDGTVEIVKKYGSKIAVFRSERDKGIYDAMNKGIALATGDVIGILNADDFYKDIHVIDKIVKKIVQTNADGLYADLIYVEAAKTNVIKRYWKSGLLKKNSFLWGWMPPHPTFFLKKASYLQFGTYRLDLGSAADYELMLRMIHKHGVKMTYLPEITTVMRTGGVSNSSVKNRFKANQNDQLAWRINQLNPYFFSVWLKPIRKVLQFVNKP